MTTQITYEDRDAVTWPARKAALDELHAAEARAAFEQIAAPKAGSASDLLKVMNVNYAHAHFVDVERMTNLAILGPNATTIIQGGVVKTGTMAAKPRLPAIPGLYQGLSAPITDRRRWQVSARTVEPVIINTPGTTASFVLWDVEQIGPDPLDGYDRYAKQGWDGYDALSITSDTIDATRYFLEILPGTLGAPYISPGADGTIGLEWIFKDGRSLRKLFLDVGPSWTWEGYWRRASGERQTLPHKPIDVKTEAELLELFLTLSK